MFFVQGGYNGNINNEWRISFTHIVDKSRKGGQ